MPPSHAAANEDLTLYMEMKHKKNILKDTRAFSTGLSFSPHCDLCTLACWP